MVNLKKFAQSLHAFRFVLWTVQGIYISGNPVVHVHPAAFQGLRQLRELVIQSPELRGAPSLEYIGHSLTKLDLFLSNVEFENAYFKHRYKIQHLYLDKCDLRSIPPSVRAIAGSLVKLSLDVNKITTLKPLQGKRFAQLSYLDLTNNRISVLAPNALLLPRLTSMDLSENLLNQVADPSQAPWGMDVTGEVYVNLGGNPWHCDASMYWLLQALHREKGFDFITFQRNHSNVTLILVDMWYCDTPQEYHGRMVVDALSTMTTLRSRDSLKSRGMKISSYIWIHSHRYGGCPFEQYSTDKCTVMLIHSMVCM